MLVNGDPIISAINTSSYVVHHASGKLKDIKHPSGAITGNLLSQLMWGEEDRVSIHLRFVY